MLVLSAKSPFQSVSSSNYFFFSFFRYFCSLLHFFADIWVSFFRLFSMYDIFIAWSGFVFLFFRFAQRNIHYHVNLLFLFRNRTPVCCHGSNMQIFISNLLSEYPLLRFVDSIFKEIQSISENLAEAMWKKKCHWRKKLYRFSGKKSGPNPLGNIFLRFNQ